MGWGVVVGCIPSGTTSILVFASRLFSFLFLRPFPRSLLLPGFAILIYSQILSSHELECKRGR